MKAEYSNNELTLSWTRFFIIIIFSNDYKLINMFYFDQVEHAI